MAEMNSPKRMVIVVGARPQFIKAAALHRTLKSAKNWETIWVQTGQHHDEALSHHFFNELSLPQPQVTLSPTSSSRELRMGDMMHGVREVIRKAKPDWVLVFGDTDSTLAGAFAASAEGVPLIHVEAGLRSHLWSMPEEVNRILTDRLSSILICPTDSAVLHLKREGITHVEGDSPHPSRPWVIRTGDIMHDNAIHFGSSWPEIDRGRGRILLTLHRPSNVDDPNLLRRWLNSVGAWLEKVGLEATFPVHPRTANVLDNNLPAWRKELRDNYIFTTNPLGYLDLLQAVCQAPLVLTDSGGVQKEAYSLGTRCVVLRGTTEWVEQVEREQSALAHGPADLDKLATTMLNKGRFKTDDLYGTGQAANDILRCLEKV